jgi:glutamyl-tRNA synthetase
MLTRFAPSPTGLLHAGNLRTALFNRLLSIGRGGFLLRFDDTDAARSREEHVDAIRRDLAWVGVAWDREARQSRRLDAYAAAADRLREAGLLYPAYETAEELEFRRRAQRLQGRPPVYDRAALRLTNAERAGLEAEGRKPHWRFKLAQEPVEWQDGVLGPQRVDAASLSDPVLIREDGTILYTLASVVDDADFGVTDIVRGADHVTNTAVQIQLFAALGGAAPRFAHHSLLTGPGGAALSKRDGAMALRDMRAEGVEPAALVSLLSRLGSARDVTLLHGVAEAAEGFALSDFGAAPVIFDPDQLRRLSAQAVRAMPYDAAADRLRAMGVEGPKAAPFWEAARPNLDRLEDAADWWALIHDPQPAVAAEDADFVAQAMTLLPPRPWDGETWSAWTAAVKGATGRKGRALFLPLRKALTGRERGPEMGALMPLLEKP